MLVASCWWPVASWERKAQSSKRKVIFYLSYFALRYAGIAVHAGFYASFLLQKAEILSG